MSLRSSQCCVQWPWKGSSPVRAGAHPSGTAGAKPQRDSGGSGCAAPPQGLTRRGDRGAGVRVLGAAVGALLVAVVLVGRDAFVAFQRRTCAKGGAAVRRCWAALGLRSARAGGATDRQELAGPRRVGFRGLCSPQKACGAHPSVAQSEGKHLDLCRFALNFSLMSICRGRVPLNYGGSFVHLCIVKAAPPTEPVAQNLHPKRTVQRDKRGARQRGDRQTRVRGRAVVQPARKGGQRHAR